MDLLSFINVVVVVVWTWGVFDDHPYGHILTSNGLVYWKSALGAVSTIVWGSNCPFS